MQREWAMRCHFMFQHRGTGACLLNPSHRGAQLCPLVCLWEVLVPCSDLLHWMLKQAGYLVVGCTRC